MCPYAAVSVTKATLKAEWNLVVSSRTLESRKYSSEAGNFIIAMCIRLRNCVLVIEDSLRTYK